MQSPGAPAEAITKYDFILSYTPASVSSTGYTAERGHFVKWTFSLASYEHFTFTESSEWEKLSSVQYNTWRHKFFFHIERLCDFPEEFAASKQFLQHN